MSEFTVFAFDSSAVRVVVKGDEPWFVAVDLCRILEIANSRDALDRLDDDEKGVALTDTLGGQQQVGIVNESGMYALVFKSRKPEAKRFRKWVTSEVLPAIRKTGRYVDQTFRAPTREAATMLSVDTDQFVSARRIFNSSISAARTLRMPLQQAIATAAEVAMRRTGIDMLAELDAADLVARLGKDAAGGAFGDRSLPMHLQPFWEAFTGGQIDARLPVTMLVSQFNTLYRHWCMRNGYAPLSEARMINALKTADVLSRGFVYYTDAERRYAYRDHFMIADSNSPEHDQLMNPEWMGDRVLEADAVLDDLNA